MTVVYRRPSRLYSALLNAWLLIAGGSTGENWVMLVIHRDDPIKDPYRDPIEIL